MYPRSSGMSLQFFTNEIRSYRSSRSRRRHSHEHPFTRSLTVTIIYTLVMFSYVSENGLTLGMSGLTESQQAAIIPKKELFTAGGIDVGARFFQLTIGHAITNPASLANLLLGHKGYFGNGKYHRCYIHSCSRYHTPATFNNLQLISSYHSETRDCQRGDSSVLTLFCTKLRLLPRPPFPEELS